MMFTIPYKVPSQNERENNWHWAKRGRDTKLAQALIQRLRGSIANATGKRFVHILSYRQRMLDDANLVGGAKGLVDALKRANLIIDDTRSMVTVTYDQKLLSELPKEIELLYGKKPATTIHITEFTDISKE